MKLNEKHVFVISAIFLVLASLFSVGYYHFDEHFQIQNLLDLNWV